MTAEPLQIAKADDLQQNIYGWANVAVRKDGTQIVDLHGDLVDITELEKAAHEFVLTERATGDMHRGEAVGSLVESVVFTPEKMAKMGIPEGALPQAWWVGFHIPDRAQYEKAKNGRLAFSIEGTAVREAA